MTLSERKQNILAFIEQMQQRIVQIENTLAANRNELQQAIGALRMVDELLQSEQRVASTEAAVAAPLAA